MSKKRTPEQIKLQIGKQQRRAEQDDFDRLVNRCKLRARNGQHGNARRDFVRIKMAQARMGGIH